jgi:hypothetical protein
LGACSVPYARQLYQRYGRYVGHSHGFSLSFSGV